MQNEKKNLKFKTFAEQETLSHQLSQAAARRTEEKENYSLLKRQKNKR